MRSLLGHIELPEGTLCPFNKEGDTTTLREKGIIPKLSVFKGSSEIKRCLCGRRHYPNHFDAMPEVYNTIQTGIKRLRAAATSSESESEFESEFEPSTESNNLIVSNTFVSTTMGLGEAKKDLFDSLLGWNATCDTIADNFQKTVDCSPNGYLHGKKSDKEKLDGRIRTTIWRLRYNDINKAECPCCRVNEISYDHYHVGHIHPESKMGSNEISNYLPICSTCNTKMGVQHLYAYAWKTYRSILWDFPKFG